MAQRLDNIEKRTDVVIEKGVVGIFKGDQPQVAALGLSEGGMTLTGIEPGVEKSGCLIAKYPEVIEKVKELRDEIASGKLKIEDPMKLAK